MAPPAICLLLFSSDGLYLLLLASVFVSSSVEFLYSSSRCICGFFFLLLIISAIKIFASN